MQQILTITQINEYIRTLLDTDGLLCNIAVKGEISNYKVYPSGHHYFSLKDEGGTLKCVMFRSSAVRLKFKPENGMQIIALGKISVYPRDGAYQLYCTALALDGVGDLHTAFEQLKAKLASQGLFDAEHKKPIPRYPGRIGIVTSSAGAAIHDMLRILKKRYPLTQVYLLPVRVQGAEAPREIAEAIRYANQHHLADLLIVGRGGGSIEDLWAFNDEQVAHAIYDSEIPVISAVGHEPDVTISDYVADLRAATPSNAAELAVADQDAVRQSLDRMHTIMATSILRQLKGLRQHLQALSASPSLHSPVQYINNRRETIDLMSSRIQAAQQRIVSEKKQRFISLTAKLDAMSPLKVLTRGYAIVASTDGTVVRSIKQISPGEQIKVSFNDGNATAMIQEITEDRV